MSLAGSRWIDEAPVCAGLRRRPRGHMELISQKGLKEEADADSTRTILAALAGAEALACFSARMI